MERNSEVLSSLDSYKSYALEYSKRKMEEESLNKPDNPDDLIKRKLQG